MKVKELILELQKLNPELQEKEIRVLAENDMWFSPNIKFMVKDFMKPLDKSSNNVEAVVLIG